MADFLDAEAVESEDEEELTEVERKKARRLKAVESDDEDDSDDEQRMQEELQDLIDDNPVEEDSGSESDSSRKRKKSDDELDDRFEDEDYDLIEENLGVKVARRKRFKRLKRMDDDEEDEETGNQEDREAIANELFTGDSDEEGERPEQRRTEEYDEEDEELGDSDPDDFIVDEEGRPLTERKKKRKHIFNDAALQEAQDIFGVDFDFDDFDKYDEDYDEEDEEDEEDDYIDETGECRRKKSKKVSRKKTTRKSIFEIYEPSELKRGHFTDLDNKIRNEDIPERMQLRDVPVTKVPEDSNELNEEAEWIYRQLFCRPTVSTQEVEGGADPRKVTKKGNTAVAKIKNALHFMRNDHFEVPFIAFYRKEYVLPELNVNDLWKVFKYDGKWCQLKARKEALQKLFDNMRQYQLEEYSQDDSELPDDYRPITDKDIEQLKAVETAEELNDVHQHFLLYYSHLIPKMLQKRKAKEREERKRERQQNRRKRANVEGDDESVIDENNEENPPEDEQSEPEVDENEMIKPAARGGPYTICRKAKLGAFAKRFGLDSEKFAENVRDDYQTHDVQEETVPEFPLDLAKEFCNSYLSTPEDVLKAAKYMMATHISREPLVKKVLREAFFKRAKVNVKPTPRGIKEIDENHPCFAVKYLKGKPVAELVGFEFLKLHMAEEDKLLQITFDTEIDSHKSLSYLEDMKALFKEVGFQREIEEWNDVRGDCVELAYRKMLIPSLIKELRTQLLAEAKECLLKIISKKIYNWLMIAPYTVDFEEEDDEWDTSKGLRIMGLAYENDFSQSPFACVIASDGECVEFKKLPNLLKRKNSYRDDERKAKEKDLAELRDFIARKKPHAICIGAESREALMIAEDIKEVVKQLVEDEQFPLIPVEILDNEFSKVYSNSIKGTNDFRDYPVLLRQAISLARRLQDPLVEFSQLCTSDDEILCLRYHYLQDHITQEELMNIITQEFVNRTNEVGVDLNAVVQNPYSGNLLQFVCGLGSRKATALIKMFRQTNQRLENRSQLVTVWHMGRTIFVNCSGFIKIDTGSLGDSTDAYVEVLDGSRVHPEAYEWARKMAVDALEYDDDETNPTQALEEILESPDRLKDLDLDAFAEELAKQNFGRKSITLYDIRAELNCLYKDRRIPYTPPTADELFDMLTKENPETFYNGKMVQATVIGITRRKPKSEELDQANPNRKDETGLWQCPFCLKSDFPELSEVWNHFDAGGCPGQATGVRVRLDNGINGYIHLKNLSDKHISNPEERVKLGQVIHCRIMKIDVEKFSVEATSKSTDLNDINNKWRPQKDVFYDLETEEKDRQVEEKKKKIKAAQIFIKRPILHPNFKNISYKASIALLESMDQGECIIRPSSKGVDHLTLTWKVTNNIYQHIDIVEKKDEKQFKLSLGKALYIGREEFTDLDEIIARFVEPMAANAREIINNKYYKDTDGGKMEKAQSILLDEKEKNSGKIHYLFTATAKHPGRFMLSYLPRDNCRHEYITVTFEGFRFRGQMFESVNGLLKWFKDHFREPIPGTPMPNPNTPFNMQTPMIGLTPAITPYAYNMPPAYGPTPAAYLTPRVIQSPYPRPGTPADPSDWGKIAAEWSMKKRN